MEPSDNQEQGKNDNTSDKKFNNRYIWISLVVILILVIGYITVHVTIRLHNQREAEKMEQQYEDGKNLLSQGRADEAEELLGPLHGYKDSDQLMRSNSAAYYRYIQRNIVAGDYLYFGNYEDTPLKWIVLDRDEEKLICITERIVDLQPYDRDGSIFYVKSDARSWINDEFYQTTFTEGEKKYIVPHFIDTEAEVTSSLHHVYPDSVTDNLYLMSSGEFFQYFNGQEKNEGVAMLLDADQSFSWWLRNQSSLYTYCAMCVERNGKCNSQGEKVQHILGIRPMVDISLSGEVPENIRDTAGPEAQEKAMKEAEKMAQEDRRRDEEYIASHYSEKKSDKNKSFSYHSNSSNSRNSSYSSGYHSAEDYAEDYVEDYLDSGDYDDYDEAYEAAMDDYEFDHDY